MPKQKLTDVPGVTDLVQKSVSAALKAQAKEHAQAVTAALLPLQVGLKDAGHKTHAAGVKAACSGLVAGFRNGVAAP